MIQYLCLLRKTPRVSSREAVSHSGAERDPCGILRGWPECRSKVNNSIELSFCFFYSTFRAWPGGGVVRIQAKKRENDIEEKGHSWSGAPVHRTQAGSLGGCLLLLHHYLLSIGSQ